MNETFVAFVDRLQGDFLERSVSGKFDLDEYLDERDEKAFEEQWLRVYSELELLKADLTQPQLEQIEKVREAVFKRVFVATEHPELSGAISDDLGLIALATMVGYSDGWLNSLWVTYRGGSVPGVNLDPVREDLSSLV